MGAAQFAGFGGLADVGKERRADKKLESELEAAALERVLRQQQENRAQEEFNLRKPITAMQPDIERLNLLQKVNPDVLSAPQGIDLFSKIGLQFPKAPAGTPSDQVYQGTGVGIPLDRQLAISKDLTGIENQRITNDIYKNIGPSLGLGGQPQPQASAPPNALPPPEQRVEGQTYTLPNGANAVWSKTPSGGFGLKAISPQAQGMIGSPELDRKATAYNILGNLPGPLHGMKASEVPSLDAAAAAQKAAAVTKANLDAKGYVTPAMEQRALEASKSASTMYNSAISELEKMFPGIDQSYNIMQAQKQSPSVMSWITGKSIPYDDLKSTMRMFEERKKYDPITSLGLGMATPFGKSIAATNLANVSAMMGLNPGSRAVGILEQLYKQHQPQIGYESALQTYAKLRYLRDEGLKQVADAIRQPEIQPYPNFQQQQ